MDATNLANFEYQVALLGGPSVGKTSLMRKIINNYMEDDQSEGDSVISISQESMKHTIKTDKGENIAITFYDTKGHHVKSTMN